MCCPKPRSRCANPHRTEARQRHRSGALAVGIGVVVRGLAARVAALIRVDAVWLATEPIDMRAGTETALARVVKVFGAVHPHLAGSVPSDRGQQSTRSSKRLHRLRRTGYPPGAARRVDIRPPTFHADRRHLQYHRARHSGPHAAARHHAERCPRSFGMGVRDQWNAQHGKCRPRPERAGIVRVGIGVLFRPRRKSPPAGARPAARAGHTSRKSRQRCSASAGSRATPVQAHPPQAGWCRPRPP